MLPRIFDVDESCCGGNGGIRSHHHHVSVRSEKVDESSKSRVPDFHGLKVGGQFAAGEFKLLDDIGNLLKSMNITMVFALLVRDDKKGRPFEQQHLIGVNDVGKLGEVLFEDVNVWNEEIDDGRPSFVKSLVPNGRSEAGAIQRLG